MLAAARGQLFTKNRERAATFGEEARSSFDHEAPRMAFPLTRDPEVDGGSLHG